MYPWYTLLVLPGRRSLQDQTVCLTEKVIFRSGGQRPPVDRKPSATSSSYVDTAAVDGACLGCYLGATGAQVAFMQFGGVQGRSTRRMEFSEEIFFSDLDPSYKSRSVPRRDSCGIRRGLRTLRL